MTASITGTVIYLFVQKRLDILDRETDKKMSNNCKNIKDIDLMILHHKETMKQFNLAVSCIPAVAEESCFAIKGGMAINLFLWNLPRISVDIDLLYLPVKPKSDSYFEIKQAFQRIIQKLKSNFGYMVNLVQPPDNSFALKLVVQNMSTSINIEMSPTLWECVYAPIVKKVNCKVERMHHPFKAKIASIADIYAGKFIAALTRQHPCDLYDVYYFFKHAGLTDEVRLAFLFYLLDEDIDIIEVLEAKNIDITDQYNSVLRNLMFEHVILNKLNHIRGNLKNAIVKNMPDSHKKFLISFLKGEPDWRLLGNSGIQIMQLEKWNGLKSIGNHQVLNNGEFDRIKFAIGIY